MAVTATSAFPAVSYISTSTGAAPVRARGHIPSFFSPNFSRPNVIISHSPFKSSRLRFFQKIGTTPKHVFRVPIMSCLDDQSEASSKSEPGSVTNDSRKEAAVDLKLPRRSLLVHFTCGACGERTQRLVNKVAYERGTVFVQCAGCLQHHKLIDNLGLVVEYDLREESEIGSIADQV
ncbi:hypothetical protein NMG60_11009462 [Bertholletia excelsa]